MDPEYRVQPAGWFDAPDERFDGRDLLQQHDSVGNGWESSEHALAEQSDAGAELESDNLQRHHQHQLHFIGLQRLSAESGSGGFVSLEFAAFSVAMDPLGPGLRQNLETREYATLAQYSQATGQDRNSILVDYDIFMNVRRLDAQDVTTLQKLYKAEDFDFRLKPDRLPWIEVWFCRTSPMVFWKGAGSRRAGSRCACSSLWATAITAKLEENMRKILVGLLVSAPLLFAQQAPRVLTIQDLFTRNVGNTEQQNKQVPPHEIIGNVYYVGRKVCRHSSLLPRRVTF